MSRCWSSRSCAANSLETPRPSRALETPVYVAYIHSTVMNEAVHVKPVSPR